MSLTFFRCAAGHAIECARAVATKAVDAVAGCALRAERTGRSIRLWHLRRVTRCRAIAFTGDAFVVRIGVRRNGPASAIVTAPFFGGGTRHARADTHVATTHAVDAIIRKTLARRGTRRTVVITARARAVALSAIAFGVGVRFRRDRSARAIGSAAFFRCAARFARFRTRRIAAISVDAIARCALTSRYARRSIGQRRLRLIASSGAITFAGIAFAFLVASGAYRFANAVVAVAFFPVGAGITELVANVAAAVAVDAIVGQTLRFVRARHAVVIFAGARAIACTGPAFVVVVLVVRNEAARAVRSAAFFGCGAGHARSEAPAVATHAVGAITRLALRGRCTRGAVGIRCLRARITRSRTIAFAGIAFVVGIRRRFDGSTNAIIAAAFFRRTACLACAHADVAATIAVDTIVRQTAHGRGASNAVVILALVFPVARTDGAIVVGIGVVRNGSANAIRARTFLRRAARHALVIAFRVATKPIHAKARRTLTVQRTRGRRSRRRNQLLPFSRRIPTRVVCRVGRVFRRFVGSGFAHSVRNSLCSLRSLEPLGMLCAATQDEHHHHPAKDQQRPSSAPGLISLLMWFHVFNLLSSRHRVRRASVSVAVVWLPVMADVFTSLRLPVPERSNSTGLAPIALAIRAHLHP